MSKFNVVLIASALGLLLSVEASRADTILWIDDTSGNIGQVDLTNQSVVGGSVHGTGQALTDIGFTEDGTLYGTSFTNLYSIDTATGAATNLGSYGSPNGANALVGSGSGLLVASVNNTTVNSITNPLSPGSPAVFGTSPLASAGDLAFSAGTLFESGVNGGADALVNVTNGTVVGNFHIGATTFNGVFGLADDGTTLYAVDGTNVYSVDPTDASLTLLFDYGTNSQGLGDANGTAFINEATPAPEPASLGLLGAGIIGLGILRRRNGRNKTR